MKSKRSAGTGLTRISTETDYETEDYESDIEEPQLVLKSNERKRYICQNKKCKFVCIAFSIIAAAIFCFFIINFFALAPESKETIMTEERASFVIEELMQLNISYDYFDDDEKEEYIHAFNAFDKNGDQSLDQSEFVTYFKLQLNNWAIFDRIDVNSDDILSFAECVSYLQELNKITEVHIDLITTITQQIIVHYGVEIEENELNSLFLQYAAIFLYFEEFDHDLNGFINKNDYLEISARNQFNAIDLNKDYKITPGELSIVLYGDLSTDYSWTSKLKNIFGENYENVMHALETTEATPEIVESVSLNLQISPVQINNIANSMQQNNTLKDANKQHICFRNNYCYFSYFGADTKDTKHIFYPPVIHEIFDPILPNNQLHTDEENDRIKEAQNICNQQNCCREDDDKLYASNPQQSACPTLDYLQCLSPENECVWDCLLPQENNDNAIHFKRVFKGIDRRIAHKIEHPQTTKEKETATANEINMDYLSLAAMDECGTVYEYELTNDAMEQEYANILVNPFPKKAVEASEATIGGHRRLRRATKPGEMNEDMRRKLGVLGVDRRVDVTANVSPYNKNVFILFDTYEGTMRCSGSLISPKHVLTAGHCVSDGTGAYFWNFKVYPAYNVGNTETYFTAQQVVAFVGWHYYGDWNWDMSIITLQTADTGYGWFSFGYNNYITTSSVFGVNGYPVDKGEVLQHQWMRFDYQIYYNSMVTQTGDFVGGNSGGPAWEQDSQIVYGVGSYETWSSDRPRIYQHNGFTRITPGKYDTICAYMRGFAPTSDFC